MSGNSPLRVVRLASLVALFSVGLLRAAELPPDDVLANHGLKHVGSLYVLESEGDARRKLDEVKLASRQLKLAEMRQASIPDAKDQKAVVQDLTAGLNQIKAELAAVNQQMNHLPRWRGRFANNYVQQERAELMAYRAQLNAAAAQQNALINQVKTHPPDPKAKASAEAEVVDRRDRYDQAVRALIDSVAATRAKYAELAGDAEVKLAIERLERQSRSKSILGPSHEFREIVKLVEKLEKEGRQAPFAPAAKGPARKARAPGRSPS